MLYFSVRAVCISFTTPHSTGIAFDRYGAVGPRNVSLMSVMLAICRESVPFAVTLGLTVQAV